MGKIRFERYVCFEVRPSVGLEAKHPTRSNIPSARALTGTNINALRFDCPQGYCVRGV